MACYAPNEATSEPVTRTQFEHDVVKSNQEQIVIQSMNLSFKQKEGLQPASPLQLPFRPWLVGRGKSLKKLKMVKIAMISSRCGAVQLSKYVHLCLTLRLLEKLQSEITLAISPLRRRMQIFILMRVYNLKSPHSLRKGDDSENKLEKLPALIVARSEERSCRERV